MRTFIVACLIAALLMLYAAPVTEGSPEDVGAPCVLLVEAECPFGLDGCAAPVGLAYDTEVEFESMMLKLPSERTASSALNECRQSGKLDQRATTSTTSQFHEHVTAITARHPLKLLLGGVMLYALMSIGVVILALLIAHYVERRSCKRSA